MRTLKAGVVAAVVLYLFSSVGALAVDKVSVAMNWVLVGEHSPYFLAVDRGYYKAEGIDPTIGRGHGSGDTVRRVDIGEVMFGNGDTSAAVVGRARGAKVKVLAALMAKSPQVIFSLKKTGIRAPADLKGKNIGGGKGDVVRIVFPAFAKINGLDPQSVKWVATTPAAKASLLLSGQLDAITNFITDLVPLEAKAKEMGVEIAVLQSRDWGLDPYGNSLFTSDKLITENKDLVARFVRASMKGFAAALEDPEAAVAAITREVPALSREVALKQLQIASALLLSQDACKHGLGTVNEKRMSIMIDVLASNMDLPRKISTGEIYTNEFLPAILPKKGC